MRKLLLILLCALSPIAVMSQVTRSGVTTRAGVTTAAVGVTTTFTEIQGKWGAVTSSGTTLTVTLTSAPTAGNGVICSVQFYPQSLTVSTVKDNATSQNSYTATTNSPSNTNVGATSVSVFYLANAPSGAGATITATLSGAITYNSFIGCEEIHKSSGTIAFDVDAATSTATSGTAVNAPSITPSAAGEFLFGAAAVQNGIASFNSPWAATSDAGTTSTNVGGIEIILAGASGATAMNMTAVSTSEWNSMIAAFK